MNKIESIGIIKRNDLDEKNYFQSLIEQAYEKQLLSEEEMIDLKIQLTQLLDERVYRYNGIESSSIREEIMQEIFISNLYTISIYLKKYRNPDDAIKKIKEKGLIEIYKEGRRQIDKILDVIRVMYIKLIKNKINISNQTYNDTIIGGIQGFLKIYDPDYKSQDMKITADYPIFNNLIGKLDGVEFIKEYINSIYLENEFCNKFQIKKIIYLLYRYADDYKELIFNIFEVVLLEVLGCELVDRNIQDLAISEDELNQIYMLFENKEKDEIKEIIVNAYNNIKEDLLSNDVEIQKYIEKNFEYIIDVIINAFENNTLDKVFIIQKFIEE